MILAAGAQIAGNVKGVIRAQMPFIKFYFFYRTFDSW